MAKANGALINRECARRRKDAQAEGRSFMPYTAAKAHLRKVIIGVAAGDPASIMTRVLGDEDGIPDPQSMTPLSKYGGDGRSFESETGVFLHGPLANHLRSSVESRGRGWRSLFERHNYGCE